MRSIAIQIFDEKHLEAAEQCSHVLGLDIVSACDEKLKSQSPYQLLLCCDGGAWFLRQNIHYFSSGKSENKTLKQAKKERLGDLHINFVSGALKHRFLYGGGKGQDIAKAVGIAKNKSLSVLDATAGLGRDAFVLASLGCHVEMCEENQIVHFLLDHALVSGLEYLEQNGEDLAHLKEVLKRMSVQNNNSLQLLKNKRQHWDVIYLDPMFPERNKSAKVKKEMQYLHCLLENDINLKQKDDLDTQLLEAALTANCSRVVVKRPSHAPSLSSKQKPSYSIKGKSTRFDVYALKSLKEEIKAETI